MALARIQRKLERRKLSLQVYDCYRPLRAIRDFVRWARKSSDRTRKAEYYPTIKKGALFRRHYISTRSTHPYGNTVDLTIIPLGSKPPRFDPAMPQRACHLPRKMRKRDNSLDFGTGYDCFHPFSGSALPRSRTTARGNRRLLNRLMRAEGFRGYKREWWHFSLPGAGTRRPMDFPVRPVITQRKIAERPEAGPAVFRQVRQVPLAP